MTPKPTAAAVGGGSIKGGGLVRDLLSSVAQQVESHLHPYYTPTSSSKGRLGRRSGRIRSWIVQDKDRLSDEDKDDSGNNSLRFTDGEDDDFTRDSHRATDPAIHTHKHHNQSDTEARMHMHPDEIREEEAVDALMGLMGDEFDREVARRILRKYDGNVDKAAVALLEGERGEEMGAIGPQQEGHQIQSQGWPAVTAPSASNSSWSGAPSMLVSQTPQTRLDVAGKRPNTPVIDLTLDDDPEFQRAMQESMDTLRSGGSGGYLPSYPGHQSLSQLYPPTQGEDQMMVQSQQQPERPVFGPSERAPDSNWAMVPSQQHESNDDSYLQNLNRAIEASLEMEDPGALEPFPVEQQLRRDGCPVVLRPSMHSMVHAATILQGLFYVPQVRVRMARWRPPLPTNLAEAVQPTNGPDFTMWTLSEIFTHMDLARLCDLNVDKLLHAFSIEPWDKLAQPPGELSRKFFAKLSETLERAFMDQWIRDGHPAKPRLLHFQYGSATSEPGELLQETSVVPIDVNGGESNDLIGRLSAQLSKPQSEQGKQSVIFEPSVVVAFELLRSLSTPSTTTNGGGSNKKTFTYPKSIYLDQFLRENAELAQAKRKQKQEMLDEVQRLVLHKKTLTNFDGKDTLKDLRSSIFYFENVADASGDSERGNLIQAATQKLKGILTTIEEGIKAADENIDILCAQAETLLHCEELQQFKYDLRVVFVHDGLYGRKHLYSYVYDKSCWWKIADSQIEKVSEDVVLNDQAGLHLGAGPYLLVYSQAMEDEEMMQPLPWIDDIKDEVRAANKAFLSQLPPELVGDILIDEEMIQSTEKNGDAGEGMDVTP